MKIQYLSDSTGQPMGVFIPIEEWNLLKIKFQGIEEENIGVPAWQIDLVKERLEDYRNNPGSAFDYDNFLTDLDKELK
ncbi:MAG: hypothetical protein AB9834_07265 [Lentimicrobium sp.]